MAEDEKVSDAPPPDKGDFIWRIHHRFNDHFGSFRDLYTAALRWSLERRALVFGLFCVFFVISFALAPLVGEDFFPSVDAGQIALHAQGPPGQRLEETNHFFHQVDATIREVIPPGEIETILDNIGIPNSGINLSSSGTSTIGELDGQVLISLKRRHTPVQETHRYP